MIRQCICNLMCAADLLYGTGNTGKFQFNNVVNLSSTTADGVVRFLPYICCFHCVSACLLFSNASCYFILTLALMDRNSQPPALRRVRTWRQSSRLHMATRTTSCPAVCCQTARWGKFAQTNCWQYLPTRKLFPISIQFHSTST